MRSNLALGLMLLGTALLNLLFVIGLATAMLGAQGEESSWVAGAVGFAVLGTVSAVCTFFGVRALLRYRLTQRLLAHGVPGRAMVLQATTTGVTENRTRVLVVLTLRITAAGHETYETTVREFVAMWHLGSLAGADLPVLLDPTDRRKMMIDWSRAGTVLPG